MKGSSPFIVTSWRWRGQKINDERFKPFHRNVVEMEGVEPFQFDG